MLILSRKKSEMIVIRNDDDPSFKILIGVADIRGSAMVRLGFLAPKNIKIHRHEVDAKNHRDSGQGGAWPERKLVSIEGSTVTAIQDAEKFAASNVGKAVEELLGQPAR